MTSHDQRSRMHCILEQSSWPHRAVAAGQTVASVFLEGTWNTRRVLFSGFRCDCA